MPIPELTFWEKVVAIGATLLAACTGWRRYEDAQRQRLQDRREERRREEYQQIRDEAKQLLDNYRTEKNEANRKLAEAHSKIERLTLDLMQARDALSKREAEIFTLKARIDALEEKLDDGAL